MSTRSNAKRRTESPPQQQAPPPKKAVATPPTNEGQQSNQPTDHPTDTEATAPPPDSGHRPMRQAVLPYVKKPKAGALTPRKKRPPTNKHKRCVTTQQTRCDCTLGSVSNTDDSVAYNKNMSQYLRNDPVRARAKHGVDRTHCMRDPNDPTKLWSQDVGRTSADGKPIKRMKEYFIHVPDNASERTPEFSKKFGEHLVAVHNNPAFLRGLWGTNNEAYYAGDLTPSGERTYLSDHLTIKHTLDVVAYSHSDRDIDDLVQDDTILTYYFPRSMWDQVREYHANFSRRNRTEEEDEDSEEGIPSLEL